MELPSVERIQLRPPGADGVVPVPNQVIPVAPVNPPVAEAHPVVGVVNEINPALQARVSHSEPGVQVSQPDPLRGSQADNSQRDWTERKPAPEKLPEPQKEPLTKVLVEQVHAMWQASARAVDFLWQQYIQAQNPTQQQALQQSRNQLPSAIPGLAAKETITYTMSKVPKNERMARSNPSDSEV